MDPVKMNNKAVRKKIKKWSRVKKYEEIKKHIPELKKIFSSSCMTSLQKNAYKSQKWPLLNLARQILSFYNYKMNIETELAKNSARY